MKIKTIRDKKASGGRCALIIEDDPSHMELIMEVIADAGDLDKIICIDDGDEALQFFKREGKYRNEMEYPRPDLILLDLKLPGANGKTVLRYIKTQKSTRSIPVVVLTSSSHDQDIEECYRLGANSYIEKPISFEDFLQKVSAIPSYWAMVNTLPKGGMYDDQKVLIVEDNSEHRELIRTSILDEMPAIQVTEAHDASTALDALSQENFDAIILDYKLPDMDGIQFLEKSKELRGDTQTIMVTGHGNKEVESNVFKLGVVDYYVKTAELPKIVGQAVRQIFTEKSKENSKRIASDELINPMVSLLRGF